MTTPREIFTTWKNLILGQLHPFINNPHEVEWDITPFSNWAKLRGERPDPSLGAWVYSIKINGYMVVVLSSAPNEELKCPETFNMACQHAADQLVEWINPN
jgi:hypothetical protein